MTKTRPPPRVLLIHNGMPYAAHIAHLSNAGLNVTEAHADQALRDATTQQPDIIVLDFGCDGEMTAALKAHEPTAHIPVIALVDLVRPE
jgi:CheY-like chemotaxis protein